MESHNHLPYMDADNHLWEPDDAFSRHIEMRYDPYTIRVVRDTEGRGTVFFGDRPAQLQSTSVIGPTGAPPPPGFFAGLRTGGLADPERFTLSAFHKAQAEYGSHVPGVDRDAHLASMDAFGVQASLVFPSMSVEYELRSHQPPEVVDGVLRAFNRWLEEDWGFAHQDRLFAVPLISMTEPVLAVGELDRVLAAGARAIQILPGKRANGKSPADLDLDPFWARVNESGTLVCFHIGDSGAQDIFQFDLAETGQRNTGFNRSALQWYVHADRPIMDTIAMLVMHNLFGRFPNVRVASIENGSGWLAYLLKRLDMAADAGRGGPWLGGHLSERPSEIIRQHVLVSPYMVEDLHALVDLIGAKNVLYGSDFPHPEDSQPPASYLQALDGLEAKDVQAIMYDNLSTFLRPI